MARRTKQRLPARREVYLDTSAFIAFLDRSDSYHDVFRHLFAAPPALSTSTLVVAEGHGWFLRRYDRRRAMQFLAFIDALPALTIHVFDASELSKVRRVLMKFDDRNLTLADAHGLVVMRQYRISTCWSTDRHMGLTGARMPVI